MRIYTSDNGEVYVNAISKLGGGAVTDYAPDGNVEGHLYTLNAGGNVQSLQFQLGTVPEVGHNGTTNEALIAAVIHRLKFLNGKFPCRENALAITKIEEAKMWLEERTRNRIERGVEGKHQD